MMHKCGITTDRYNVKAHWPGAIFGFRLINIKNHGFEVGDFVEMPYREKGKIIDIIIKNAPGKPIRVEYQDFGPFHDRYDYADFNSAELTPWKKQ